ncbi:MAG: hypothetical protein WCQ55_01715 [Paludibacteraceae bacterium]
MTEYDIDKLSKIRIDNNSNAENVSDQGQKQPKYFLAFIAGFGASIIIAIILSLLAIWLETEYWYALAFGAVLVSLPIKYIVPNFSIVGGIMGFIFCPFTYFLYQKSLIFKAIRMRVMENQHSGSY